MHILYVIMHSRDGVTHYSYGEGEPTRAREMAIEDGFEVRAISGCCAWRLWRSKVAVSALEKANEEGREERKYGWDTGRRNTVTPA